MNYFGGVGENVLRPRIKHSNIMCNFDESTIEKVWRKGHVVVGRDENVWRKDDCGAWIHRREHGNRNNVYGWEIDHKELVRDGGTDDLDNLRPLQWKNNAARQDGPLVKKVVALYDINIDIDKLVKEFIRRIQEGEM